MPKIIKVFKEEIPTLRFIGKKYDNFGHWDEWWENGWFDLLEQTMGGPEKVLAVWENGGGYIGVERRADGAEWSFENCLCPRYTTPGEQGNVILDYCYFVHKEEAAK